MTSRMAEHAADGAIDLRPVPSGPRAWWSEARARGAFEPSAPRLAAAASLGLALALAVGIVAARSEVLAAPGFNGLYRAIAVAAWIGAGLVTWRLRPGSRLAGLFVASGCVYAVTTLQASASPQAFTLGRFVWALLAVLLVYVLLAFPRGSLEAGAGRWLFAAMAGGTLALWTPLALGARELPIGAVLTRCDGACPQNPYRIFTIPATSADVLARSAALLTAAVALAAGVLILRRLRTVHGLARRTLVPSLACLLVWAVGIAISNALRTTGDDGAVALAIGWVGVIAALCFPAAMVIGQLRGRLFASATVQRALADLARHAQGRDLRGVLADALGDPSLQLYFWAPEARGYVDVQGRPARLEDEGGARSVTELGAGGERVAAIVHARTLDEFPGVAEAAAAGAMLALENARLAARLRASTEALRASRARIVAAAEAERRRIERDLHDGAQNRLVALRIELGIAATRAAELDDDDLHATLVGLGEEAQEALDGVRSIAHGLYPPLLASRGLRDALAAEGERAPIPVWLPDAAVARSTADAEAAVYYCCLEAIQNACKHAGPDASVTVRFRREAGRLVFSVADDGAGFDPDSAPPAASLMHVRDRIAAIGGDVEVGSAPGQGTTVAGTAPWPRRGASES